MPILLPISNVKLRLSPTTVHSRESMSSLGPFIDRSHTDEAASFPSLPGTISSSSSLRPRAELCTSGREWLDSQVRVS